MELKKTPFYDRHIEAGGRIVDFSGWALPVEYESSLKEAKATRTSCSLFDASHMGEIRIEGEYVLNFLQKLTSNDLSLTKKGQLQYSLFLNQKAGVIDDLMIYNLGSDFLCVVNASNTEHVCDWLKKNQTGDLKVIDESPTTFLLSLQGPNSPKVMEEAFGKDVSRLSYMHFTEINSSGRKALISRSGYTGEDGFEIYASSSHASFFWDLILEKGRNYGLNLCGLGARDILRIEAGYPLYGHEIDGKTNPLEASLGWVVKLNKDFIGKEELLKIKKEGIRRRRVGFLMQERAPARQGYQIYAQGKSIGSVCSGTYSPNLDKFIGMAYVDIDFAKAETAVEIKIRDKLYRAKITNFTFIEARTKNELIRR